MEFGALVMPKPDTIMRDTALAEASGFTHAWIPDSHMIYGDVYACMALAAGATKKIKLGSGVSIASNRIPPVTAHSVATINQLAPGRVILGFGTGHTGRRIMGLAPVLHADFRDEVRTLRDLLSRGETIYNTEGVSRRIRFLHRDRRFINLDDKIPFYVAANGPKTLALAGEFADGIITSGITAPDRVAAVRKLAEVGAKAAGRSTRELPLVSLTHLCVQRPGEPIDSPRIKAMVGHWVMASFHAIAAGYSRVNSLPEDARPVFDEYAKTVAKFPAEERYLDLHIGHCAYVPPSEQPFVTAESIRATTMIGTRDELLRRLRALKEAGLTQMFLNPPMDGFGDYVEEIGRELVGKV